MSDGSSGFAAARERRSMDGAVQRRQATGGRRVATHSPVHAAVLRRELLGAERALCRRRARTATPSKTGAITPRSTKFSSGTGPVTLTDGA